MSTTMTSTSTQGFDHKYRPRTFSDLIFSDAATAELLSSYARRHRFGHILLHGDYGVAKSVTAQLLIEHRQLLIQNVAVNALQFHARSLAGKVGSILEPVGFQQFMTSDHAIYVQIDEVDQLALHDQQELRYLMDTMTSCRLIMTTNFIVRVDKGIANRSDCIQVKMPSGNTWLHRAQDILRTEGVIVPDALVLNLITPHNSFRTALRALEDFAVARRVLAWQPAAVAPASVPTGVSPTIAVVSAASTAIIAVPAASTPTPLSSAVLVQTAVVPAPSKSTP